MKKAFALALVLALLVSSMALAEGAVPAFTPYDETVRVSVGITKGTSLYEDGISESGNLYNDYVLKTSNIAVDYAWEVDSANYDSKIALCIASGDLPDMFVVADEQQFRTLVDNDLIEDLTGTYETSAADYIKAFYDSYGEDAFSTAMFDGKLMAIPDLNYGYQFDILWVRQDWLDKLGLAMPTTRDEVAAVAKAFIDNDMSGNGDTVGFVMYDNFAGNYNCNFQMDPLLNTFDAYRGSWVVGDDGSVSYGSVQPQMKDGLAYLADMYTNGLIDKEFAVRSTDDIVELILNGRCGITFGAWYLPDWPISNMMVSDPTANWVCAIAPLSEDGIYHPMTQQIHQHWLCVRKGYEHPEAAWQLLNYQWLRGEDPEIVAIDDYYAEQLGTDVTLYRPWSVCGSIMVQWNDAVPREGNQIYNAIQNGYDTTGLNAELTMFTEHCREFLEGGDMTMWKYYGARVLGCIVASDDSMIKTKEMVYPATTDTMALKWANLQTLESETFLKIVMGEESVDTFDDFVTNWYSMGGQEITDEINAMY